MLVFAIKDDIQDHYHFCNYSWYKQIYVWLYYSQVAHEYMHKIC